MATVLEVYPLDDVLDPGGGLVECSGFKDKVATEGLFETALYEDSLCSIQAQLSDQEPQCYEEECEDPFDETPIESQHLCEWTTTRLRLPSPPFSCEEDSDAELFLCLPIHTSETSQCDIEGPPHEDSKGYADEGTSVLHQLRLDALNKYLAAIPSLSQHHLFSYSETDRIKQGNYHRLITANNSGRVINVLQGEIATCTPSQADVLVSDDATTCHIVALWSICRNNLGKDEILATMTHVDGTGYEACLRAAVMEHIKYNCQGYVGLSEEATTIEKFRENADTHNNYIDISIHIVGGFNDDNGSSIEITCDILQVLSRLAREFDEHAHAFFPFKIQVNMTLKTCVCSGANDDGYGRPNGRGLGLDVASGEVYLAEVQEDVMRSSCNVSQTDVDIIALDGDSHMLNSGQQPMLVEGPEILLRSVRIWARSFHPLKQEQKLSVIHRPDHDCLTIEPYVFGPSTSAKFLCYMDDVRLLQMTSTSPLVEKGTFPSKVRESLSYMNQTNSRNVFKIVNGVYQTIEYRRVGCNGWVRK